MSDRKRSATVSSPGGDIDEPAAKKVALSTEGNQTGSISRHKVHKRSDLSPEILDGKLTPRAIKKFKKEALLRALSSYRSSSDIFESQAKNAQTRLESLQKLFAVQESWWSNFVDQIDVALSNNKQLPIPSSDVKNNFILKLHQEKDQNKGEEEEEDDDEEEEENSNTATPNKYEAKLVKKFNKKSSEMEKKLQQLLEWDGKVSESNDLRTELSSAITRLHTFESEYNTLKSDTYDLQSQLKDVTEKYLTAQKKISKLESPVTNALFGNGTARRGANSPQTTSAKESESKSTDSSKPIRSTEGEVEDTKVIDSTEYKQVKAQVEQLEVVVAKQLEQLKEQDRQIILLNETIRSTNHRLANLSDSDLQQSHVFRSLRRKLDELNYQLDKVDALNAQYQREKSILISERAGFQEKLRRDTDFRMEELQERTNRAESDVARIREARDEILGALNIKKAQEAEKLKSFDHLNELVEIRDSRIKSLEQEIKRIKDETSRDDTNSSSSSSGVISAEIEDNTPIEELREMVKKLKRQNASLVEELPDLEAAFNSAHQKATSKIMDFVEREAKMSKLVAEKAKADEKYFSAMRAKDALNLEYQRIRSQLTRNAEYVQQLKESESKCQHQVGALEHRVEEQSAKLTSLERERSALSSKLGEADRRIDSMRTIADRLSTEVKSKDRDIRNEVESRRNADQEIAKLKKQLDIALIGQRDASSSGGGSASDRSDMDMQIQELRTIALCSVCSKNWKDTAIKVCGHVFCYDCAMDRLTARLRKCPLCNKQYSHSDLLSIHL